MAGFVSSPPQANAAPEVAIAHDGFFPGVKLSAVRDLQRLPTQITDPRLTAAIVAAYLTASAELGAWKAAQVAAGFATLAAVLPDDQVAGKPRLVALYERAIGAFVSAELADSHHDISATNDGKARAEDRVLAADEHHRNGIHAVRDMIGATRTAIELI